MGHLRHVPEIYYPYCRSGKLRRAFSVKTNLGARFTADERYGVSSQVFLNKL